MKKNGKSKLIGPTELIRSNDKRKQKSFDELKKRRAKVSLI